MQNVHSKADKFANLIKCKNEYFDIIELMKTAKIHHFDARPRAWNFRAPD